MALNVWICKVLKKAYFETECGLEISIHFWNNIIRFPFIIFTFMTVTSKLTIEMMYLINMLYSLIIFYIKNYINTLFIII